MHTGGKRHMLGPLREDSPGRIGPYAIRARLGAGGMGEVFLGDPGDGRDPVALKTVRRDVAQDPGFRHRFRREIAVARSVTSPFLAPLLDGDADSEVPWLATGYVAGPTLSGAIRRAGAMDEGEVRMLGAGLARALAAVHAAGVVHRDVKPSNVMLAEDGPRVIDFGIARNGNATPLTTTGRMVGSPSFMSPEHVAGSGRVTFASDVFCLASVLCFAATGRDPFGDGPVAAVLYRVKYVEADLEGVPDALRAVLADCLAADPADRPTAAGLAERLAPGAAMQWPEPVRQHIAEYGRELARVRALDGPLLPGYTPTEVAAGSRTPVAQLPTQETDFAPGLHMVETQGPGLARSERPRRSRRALMVSLALLVIGGAATGGLLALRDRNGDNNTASPGGSPARNAVMVAGVDDQGGPDGSGTVPYGREVRPKDWKPWKSSTGSSGPFGCTANSTVVVCRDTAGAYQALAAVDGRKLWSLDTQEEAVGAGVSPTGQFFMPSDSSRPTVYGDTVFMASGDRLLAVDAATGETRWQQRAGGAHTIESRPIVSDGLVFASTTTTSYGSQLAAFDMRTGDRKWTAPLAPKDISKAEARNYWPLATVKGVLYALGHDGIKAFRAKDGKVLGQADADRTGPGECEDARVQGSFLYCSTFTSERSGNDYSYSLIVHRLRTPSLADAGRQAVDPKMVMSLKAGAIDGRVIAFRRGGTNMGRPDPAGVRPEIVLVSLDNGRTLGRYPVTETFSGGRRNPVSTPLIDAGTVVWADTSTLYSVKLDKDGTPGKLRRTALKGAPGPSVPPSYDLAPTGYSYDLDLLPPYVVPAGGVVHVFFDNGTALSVPLPE